MAKYVIDIDGEDVIVDGRLHIPIEISLGKGTKKPVRVDIVLDNNVTPYAESEVYYEGFQAGSANTSLVITDNTIRERIEKAYQRGYDDAKHECQDCQKIMMDAEQERVDKAYQQGLNDTENRKATCEFCEYRFLDEDKEPCRKCACNYLNRFRPKRLVPKADSRIRKKIEGIMESLDCTISDFEKAIEEIKNEAD